MLEVGEEHVDCIYLVSLAVEYPQAVFKKAWEAGLCNLAIPQSCGGAGLHGEAVDSDLAAVILLSSCPLRSPLSLAALDAVIVTEELAYG